MWYNYIMVKREDVKPHTFIIVKKAMPGNGRPGPDFTGKLEVGERLEVLGFPHSRGGMNLVRLCRCKTKETVVLLYAFVTNFCGVAKDSPPTPTGTQ